MSKADQGFKDLLAEAVRLVGRVVDKGMESEEFREGLSELNQRMSGQYGRVVDAIGVVLALEFETMPVPEGEGGGRENPSLKFRFGASKLDQKMGEELGLDEQEMNQLLEQARQEGDNGKRKDNAVQANAESLPQFPKEAVETAEASEAEETVESPDPRNISQIINSIREIARALNFQKRQFVILRLQKEFRCLEIKLPKIEQLKEDVVWLQVIQDFVSAVRKGEDAILSMSVILNFEQVLLQLRARRS